MGFSMVTKNMVINVLIPGLATSVQDLGRPGYYHIGIPLSGGMDRPCGISRNGHRARLFHRFRWGAGAHKFLAFGGCAADTALAGHRDLQPNRPIMHGTAASVQAGCRSSGT